MVYRPPEREISGPPPPKRRPGVPFAPRRLSGLWQRSRRSLAVAAALGISSGLVVGKLVVEPSYQSFAVLVWEPDEDGEEPARELRTLSDSVKLPVVLAQVREELGTPTTLDSLGHRIEVEASAESRLVTIRGRGESALVSRRLVRETVEAFLAHRRAVRAAAITERLAPVRGELREARAELESARGAWEALRAEHELADLAVERQLALERINALRAHADLALAVANGEEARAERLDTEESAEPLEVVLSEIETDPYLARLAEAERERESAASALGRASPEVLALDAEIAAVRSPHRPVRAQRTVGRNPVRDALARERRTSTSEREAARHRAETYTRLAEATRARVAELTRIEGRARLTASAVEVAERHVRELETRRVALEGAAENATADARVVAPALLPDHPETPIRRLTALACLGAWLLVGLLHAIWRTLDGARLHAPSEVAFWSGRPVVASSTWPREEEDGEALFEELARSSTALSQILVVPLTEDDRELTGRVVARWRGASGSGTSVLEWDGPLGGAPLRRAARRAARVLVVVRAGAGHALNAWRIGERLGRAEGTACLVLGVGPALADSIDRVGDADAFFGLAAPTEEAP